MICRAVLFLSSNVGAVREPPLQVQQALDTQTAASTSSCLQPSAFSLQPSAFSLQLHNNGTNNSATMLMILINGLIAGPAVSLYGSPTVSPVTAALCVSEPLPP